MEFITGGLENCLYQLKDFGKISLKRNNKV
jgi:hypothetical protein